MNEKLLERLAEWEVPPPPEHFDRELHHRVNDSLTALQIVDFAVRAIPYALLHFAQALAGAMRFTVTGRDDPPPPRRRRL